MAAAENELITARHARVTRTDELVRHAAVEILAEDGYAGLAFTRISERAGVSRRPVHDRYADRGEIAADIWNNVARDFLTRELQALFDAYEIHRDSADEFVASMQRFFTPTEELLCAIEILVVSQFDLRLRTLVAEAAAEIFEPLVAVGETEAELRKATKRAYVTAFALGLLLVARLPADEPIDIRPEARRLFTSLLLDAEMSEIPELPLPPLFESADFESGDAQLDRLLQATIDEVSERGFDGTTTVRVARRAGCSEGYLFSKYDSKLDLFVDAVRRKTSKQLKQNNDSLDAIARTHGQPVADAMMIRESLRPEKFLSRAVALEHLRIAMHNAEMRKANAESLDNFVRSVQAQNADWAERMTMSRARFSYAIGMGVAALPLIMPNVWVLPFDIATRAFAD